MLKCNHKAIVTFLAYILKSNLQSINTWFTISFQDYAYGLRVVICIVSISAILMVKTLMDVSVHGTQLIVFFIYLQNCLPS